MTSTIWWHDTAAWYPGEKNINAISEWINQSFTIMSKDDVKLFLRSGLEEAAQSDEDWKNLDLDTLADSIQIQGDLAAELRYIVHEHGFYRVDWRFSLLIELEPNIMDDYLHFIGTAIQNINMQPPALPECSSNETILLHEYESFDWDFD